ncbi:MAG TPA: DUF6020 family protein [Aeriscardovia aeriphila]|uniref:DUF6020 family protein n=1 Tax=Aeriscardovia aeriphila TaxID=218139 RepID=A0A921FUR7_9BIFI|nr:DUF6020 family protein [Aeriscardovia aeriphila]
MKEQITQNSRRVASVITAHTRTWVTWFLRIHRDEYHAAPVFARILTVAVALFLGFCTSVGPIYRANLSLSVFGFGNALTFLIASLNYWSLIIVATALIRYRTHLAITGQPDSWLGFFPLSSTSPDYQSASSPASAPTSAAPTSSVPTSAADAAVEAGAKTVAGADIATATASATITASETTTATAPADALTPDQALELIAARHAALSRGDDFDEDAYVNSLREQDEAADEELDSAFQRFLHNHPSWKSFIDKLQVAAHALRHFWRHQVRPRLHRVARAYPSFILKLSSKQSTLFWFFFIGWVWVPLIFVTAFGYDILAQSTEMHNFLNNLQGKPAPVSGFTQFDVYPIAHYLLPRDHTVFLSNQHNLLLTLFYGGMWNLSYSLFKTVVPAVVVLSVLQYIFAAFVCASIVARLVRLHPLLGFRGRSIAMGILWLSPMVTLATIELTKSPLFGFASAWWCSILVEISRIGLAGTRKHSDYKLWVGLFISTLLSLISVKYALYLMAIEVVVVLFSMMAWKLKIKTILCLVIPVVIFEGFLTGMYRSGLATDSDPIEGKAVQLQQIARVYQRNPRAIPAQTKRELEEIFDLDAMSHNYFPDDADYVKSSGTHINTGSYWWDNRKDQTWISISELLPKPETYRWRTVSAAQMKNFNKLWWQTVKSSPLIAIDAFIAEFYGYFDITDEPYVPLIYYVTNRSLCEVMGHDEEFCKSPVRTAVDNAIQDFSATPVLGWLAHGNTWVIITLLAFCVQMRLRRKLSLIWMLPLLAQMGVMVLAPANNFDRHMIGIAVMAAFVLVDLFAVRVRENSQGKRKAVTTGV